MIKAVKVMLTISGILVIIIPLVMTYVWSKYVGEAQVQKESVVTIDKCTPHEFKVSGGEDEKLIVTWKTKDACVTHILLASLPNQFTAQSEKVLPFQGSTPTTEFMAHIPRTVIKESPYMVIVSNDILYGIDESAISVENYAK